MLSALKKSLIKLLMPAKIRNSLSLLEMIKGYQITQVIYTSTKLGIPDLLKNGAVHTDELAKLIGADPNSLYRLLRALASLGICAETDSGSFELTPCGELLQTDIAGSLNAFAIMAGEPWNWQPWGHLIDSVQTGKPSFDSLFGSPFYQYLSENSQADQVFNFAMTNLADLMNPNLINAYDFSSVESLVDVGGGQGKLICSILQANPEIKGILFDLPNVVEEAQKNIAQAGLTNRCQIIGGNCHESVPSGGKVYMMKNVIHMFHDQQAINILQNCYQAMPADGKLLLLEMVIPRNNEPDNGKLLDLQMLVQINGRERTQAEYEQLLKTAGFRLTKVFPTRSPLSIIEAVPI